MWCVYSCYLGCSKMGLCGFELQGCVICLHKDFFFSIACMGYADILDLLCCKKYPVLMSQEV